MTTAGAASTASVVDVLKRVSTLLHPYVTFAIKSSAGAVSRASEFVVSFDNYSRGRLQSSKACTLDALMPFKGLQKHYYYAHLASSSRQNVKNLL